MSTYRRLSAAACVKSITAAKETNRLPGILIFQAALRGLLVPKNPWIYVVGREGD